MAQLQMGAVDAAQQSFQKGERAMQRDRPGNPHLIRLRREVEALFEKHRTDTIDTQYRWAARLEGQRAWPRRV